MSTPIPPTIPASAQFSSMQIDGLLNTGAISSTGFLVGSGTVTAPSYSFSSDTNTGMWNSSTDVLDFTTGGINRLSISTSAITTSLPISTSGFLVGSGTVTAPSYSFSSDTNTGIWNSAADTIDLTTGGINRLSLSTTLLTSNLPITVSNGNITASSGNVVASSTLLTGAGSVTTPSISFSGDTNTGFYSYSANNIGITANGTLLGLLGQNFVSFSQANLLLTNTGTNGTIVLGTGSNAELSLSFFSDSGTGFYSPSFGNITVYAASNIIQTINSTSITNTVQLLEPIGTSSAPSYSFTGDTNTGIYSSAADTLNISTGGTSRLQINNTTTLVSDTTNSTSTTTGALRTSGGLGVAKDIFCDKFTTTNPFGIISGNGLQSINNTTDTKLTATYWNGTATLLGGMTFSAGSFTVPSTGIYIITATVGFTSNPTNSRLVYFTVSGAGRYAFIGQKSDTGNTTFLSTSIILNLSASNTVEVVVWQNSGASLNMSNSELGYLALYKMG